MFALRITSLWLYRRKKKTPLSHPHSRNQYKKHHTILVKKVICRSALRLVSKNSRMQSVCSTCRIATTTKQIIYNKPLQCTFQKIILYMQGLHCTVLNCVFAILCMACIWISCLVMVDFVYHTLWLKCIIFTMFHNFWERLEMQPNMWIDKWI